MADPASHNAERERHAGQLVITARRVAGEATVLLLEGALETNSVPAVLEEVELHRGEGAELRIDLSGIDFMDSTGLAALLDITADAGDGRTRPTLIRPSAVVLRVAGVTGTTERLGLAGGRATDPGD